MAAQLDHAARMSGFLSITGHGVDADLCTEMLDVTALPSPPCGAGPVRRRSVAWFQQPNWDAVIECLPTCSDESDPPRYSPVTSGDHLMATMVGPRLLEPSKLSPRVR